MSEGRSAEAEEIARLNRCIRDVVALTALPSLWVVSDSRQVIESLADVLLGMLGLDFIAISVSGLSGRDGIKVGRGRTRPREDGLAEAIDESYASARRGAFGSTRKKIRDPWDGGETEIAVLPFNVDGRESILIAGKRQEDFPSKTDQLLLRTGINQAAVLLKRKQAEERDAFLAQLDNLLRPMTNPTEMTLAAASLLGQYLNVDRCAYADVEEDQDTMNLCGNYLRSPEVKTIVGKLKFRDFGVEVLKLMREDKPFVVYNIDTHHPPIENLDAYRATQIEAVICVPLHKNGRFVAAMAVHQRTPRQWTSAEVELVRNVASRCWESIERSRIERDLTEKYSSLFMQAPLAICVLEGPQHVFQLANSSYLSLVSAEGRELLGKPVFEALPEVSGQGFEQLLDEVYRTGIPYFGKEAPVTLNGAQQPKRLYVDFIYQPRFNSQGIVDGILVVATDVTEKVEARLNLEGAVQELRATTAENQRLLGEMRQSAQVLKDIDRRKDEFLATLAHELRNPLAPIRNSLEILRNVRDVNTIGKLRDIMEGQLVHLMRLVDDLLDMSRISEGKIELRKEMITVQAAIQMAVEASQWFMDAQQHELQLDLSAAPIWVSADPTRLTQVINNLLNNAAKYTPQGGEIRLAARQSGGTAIIEVADNGMGIPPQMSDRIFEPFTQIERNTHQSQGGLGIGLSLVRNLIQMHGGSITVVSEGSGKGSTFTVRLPLAAQPVLPETPCKHETRNESKTLKILIVDDNIDSAQTMGWMLEMKGHEPLLAYNGKDALALASEKHPEVILLDIGLPDINGYDVCRELRRNPDFKTTLIVAQTGWGQKRDRDMSHAAGFNHHLVKPVQPEDISQLLSSHFNDMRREDTAVVT